MRQPKAAMHLIVGEFSRPEIGPRCQLSDDGFPHTGLTGWQSHGGVKRSDTARGLPYSLEVGIPEGAGELVRVHITGIFALYAARSNEGAGTLGAVISLGEERSPAVRLDLTNGLHYGDATNLEPIERLTGDGASVATLGRCTLDGQDYRVDTLSIDVPATPLPSILRFRDLGSPASFVIFDVFFEVEERPACPFGSRGGGIGLQDLGAIVRVGDRVRLAKALDQLEGALLRATDLDEARGQALTFIAVVTAAMLEMGGTREMHRTQLDAARQLDKVTGRPEIAALARQTVEEIAAPLFEPVTGPSSHLIDRALAILNRNFARDLSDSDLANELGLSTSHFRYLFRESTGQPFHKYLIALRLERAKNLLTTADLPVSEVAAAVGFSGLAHFSRAFAQRFAVSPSSLRKGTQPVARS